MLNIIQIKQNFNKVLNHIKPRGLKSLLRRSIMRIVAFVHTNRLIPNKFIPESLNKRLIARKIFEGRSIKHDQRGFWYLHPMPTKHELGLYYQNTYWQMRGKDEGIGTRDIDHFLQLRNLVPDFFNNEKITFLNFGAGHGGISHLMYLNGHSVINVEPSGLNMDYLDSRWVTVTDIENISESVDFIYGSHSLEHVADIDKFENIINSKLRKGGYVFWEVPNCENPENGGCNGVLSSPHTYYFTVDYFNSLGFEVLINSTFKEGTFPNKTPSDRSGEVIRFLGRYSG